MEYGKQGLVESNLKVMASGDELGELQARHHDNLNALGSRCPAAIQKPNSFRPVFDDALEDDECIDQREAQKLALLGRKHRHQLLKRHQSKDVAVVGCYLRSPEPSNPDESMYAKRKMSNCSSSCVSLLSESIRRAGSASSGSTGQYSSQASSTSTTAATVQAEGDHKTKCEQEDYHTNGLAIKINSRARVASKAPRRDELIPLRQISDPRRKQSSTLSDAFANVKLAAPVGVWECCNCMTSNTDFDVLCWFCLIHSRTGCASGCQTISSSTTTTASSSTTKSLPLVSSTSSSESDHMITQPVVADNKQADETSVPMGLHDIGLAAEQASESSDEEEQGGASLDDIDATA